MWGGGGGEGQLLSVHLDRCAQWGSDSLTHVKGLITRELMSR